MSGPRILSLFSGYGGLDLAVQAVLGGHVVAHADIEPAACRILEHRFPGVPNLGDVSLVDWSTLGPVDVLAGGFPCQDVSAAGKRLGLRPDTRSGLWTQMAYAIDQLRPSLVVIENVRGLLSAEAHSDVEPCPWCVGNADGVFLRALGAVLGDLAGLGYDASWHGVRASDVGAPHGRFRVFIVAWGPSASDAGGEAVGLGTGLRPDEPRGIRRGRPDDHRAQGAAAHPDGDAVRQQPVTLTGCSGSTVPGLTGADAVADAERDRRTGRTKAATARWAHPSGPRTATEGRGADSVADAPGDGRHEGWSEPARILRGPDAAISGAATSPDADGAGRETRGDTGHDGERSRLQLVGPAVPTASWGPYGAAVARWERLTRPAPPPTETGAKGGQRLSPAFVEWMMGLPAGWVTDIPGLSRNEQLKALGNGVVPQQAAHALRLLLADMMTTPPTSDEAEGAA